MIKKNKIIISSIIALIVIAVVTTMLILFVPKKFKRLVSFENIDKITYTNVLNESTKELDSEEIYELLNLIINTKYNRRIRKIKLADSWYYEIYYKDGTSIRFGNATIKKMDKNSKVLSGMQYKLYDGFEYLDK